MINAKTDLCGICYKGSYPWRHHICESIMYTCGPPFFSQIVLENNLPFNIHQNWRCRTISLEDSLFFIELPLDWSKHFILNLVLTSDVDAKNSYDICGGSRRQIWHERHYAMNKRLSNTSGDDCRQYLFEIRIQVGSFCKDEQHWHLTICCFYSGGKG